MSRTRSERANGLLLREVGDILLREYDFPEGVLVTVTRVEAAPNLQEAKVYITVSPEQKSPEVMERLQKGIYGIQQRLNKRLSMRPVPKIVWKEETGAGERVERLIDEAAR